MTEQQMREQLKNAIDNTLSDLPHDAFLCQRIESAVREGSWPVRKRLLPKTAGVLAAIVLITLTTALASGLFGNVNWFGDVVLDEHPMITLSPRTTATPQPETSSSPALFALSQEILANRNDMELLVVYEANGCSWANMVKQVSSLEDFRDVMKNTSVLPIPQNIPKGYEFVRGTIMYDCQPDGQYHLIASEQPADGLTVERYTVEEGMELLHAYDLIFRRNSNPKDYLSLYAALEYATNPSEHSFGLNPDQESRVVDIADMDNALAIVSDSHTSINMRRVLDTPVQFLQFEPHNRSNVETYAEVHASVHSRQIAIDELRSIFTND